MLAGAPLIYWIGFIAVIAAIVVCDLALANRGSRPRGAAGNLFFFLFVLALAAALGLGLAHVRGRQSGLEFASGYLIELSLSIDNLFVFLVMFRSFGLTAERQKKALTLGVAGSIVMRGLFMFFGIALLDRFFWIEYLFGAFLLIAAARLLRGAPASLAAENAATESEEPESGAANGSRLGELDELGERGSAGQARAGRPSDLKQRPKQRPARWPMRRSMQWPMRWIEPLAGRWAASPSGILLSAIVAIELADLIFALDSVPAVLAVTRDPFVAYSSNIMAVVGLRSLYFLLAGLLERLRFLHYGLAAILFFVGAKMIAARWVEIPIELSLGVIVLAAAAAVAASLLAPERAKEPQRQWK